MGVATRSSEAIALARDLAPDVALVDIHLADGPTGVAVARALRGANVAFLANHGTVAVGPTMDVALQRMESLEQGARIVLAARILGGHGSLNASELRALEAAWRAGAGRGTTRGRRTRT